MDLPVPVALPCHLRITICQLPFTICLATGNHKDSDTLINSRSSGRGPKTKNMSDEKIHISSYTSHAIVLIALLVLTTISVTVAEFHLGVISVIVALLVASIKGTTVLTYFMHLKFESTFFKAMVAGVFLVYVLVIIFTLFDYLFR
jgi:cytochrome c oxidase subunit IV